MNPSLNGGRSPPPAIPLNDVGNPFQDQDYMIHAHPFERDVLEIFAKLLKLPFENSWGYITTGGTLSNEQGLLIGRERLKKRGTPILYFSEDSHYSINTSKLLAIECRTIKSTQNGEIDYKDLQDKIEPSQPVLINLNIGTTFKGAIDRGANVVEILEKLKISHYYIHADAALFGGFLPFISHESVDFEKMPYHSIAISGHKFFGSPIPMGVFLIRKELLNELSNDFIEYIYTKNVTIPCSRSSLSALLFWWILKTKLVSGWANDAKLLFKNARYLEKQLGKLGIPAYRNEDSNIVYFKAPSQEACQRWSLAQMHCRYLGPLAHVVVMQHVSHEVIDSFLEDLSIVNEWNEINTAGIALIK